MYSLAMIICFLFSKPKIGIKYMEAIIIYTLVIDTKNVQYVLDGEGVKR